MARVKDANYDLTEERVQLTTKLTETERKSRERKEEIQKLRMQYVKYILVAMHRIICAANLEITKWC